MDIKEWLEGTVQAAERPTLPDQLGFPAFLRPKDRPAGAIETAARRLGNRRRPSADSSILEPEEPAAEPLKRNRDHARHGRDQDVSQDGSSRAPSAKTALESDSDSDRYRRKPRRKTRLDRYDAKPANQRDKSKRKSRTKNHKDARPAKKRRKDKAGRADVVHNFHAKNVPCERLTLQPRTNIGIFKKGKASSPFRGRGLPDLVFSEMNFLQKRRDPAQETYVTNEKSDKRNDKAGVQGEKISAYFTRQRPPLAERHTNTQSSSHCVPLLRPDELQTDDTRRSSSIVRSIRPTIEVQLLEKEVGKAIPRSNTYFTWSESLRQSSRPVVLPSAPVLEVGELNHYRPIQKGVNAAARRFSEAPRETSSDKIINYGERVFLAEEAGAVNGEVPEVTDSQQKNGKKPKRYRVQMEKAYNAATTLSSRVTEDTSGSQQSKRSITYENTFSIPLETMPPQIMSNSKAQESKEFEPATSSSLARLLQNCNAASAERVPLEANIERARLRTHSYTPAHQTRHSSYSSQRRSSRSFSREENIPGHLLLNRARTPSYNYADHIAEDIYQYQVDAVYDDGEDVVEGIGYPVDVEDRGEDICEFGEQEQPLVQSGEHGWGTSSHASGLPFKALQQQETRRDVGGTLTGFWRPNRLY